MKYVHISIHCQYFILIWNLWIKTSTTHERNNCRYSNIKIKSWCLSYRKYFELDQIQNYLTWNIHENLLSLSDVIENIMVQWHQFIFSPFITWKLCTFQTFKLGLILIVQDWTQRNIKEILVFCLFFLM